MRSSKGHLTRRRFLGVTAEAAAVAAIGQFPQAFADNPAQPRRKTILSFYCDDTKSSPGSAKGFETFLDYCRSQGIKGESSAILGMPGYSLPRKPSNEERSYLEQ